MSEDHQANVRASFEGFRVADMSPEQREEYTDWLQGEIEIAQRQQELLSAQHLELELQQRTLAKVLKANHEFLMGLREEFKRACPTHHP